MIKKNNIPVNHIVATVTAHRGQLMTPVRPGRYQLVVTAFALPPGMGMIQIGHHPGSTLNLMTSLTFIRRTDVSNGIFPLCNHIIVTDYATARHDLFVINQTHRHPGHGTVAIAAFIRSRHMRSGLANLSHSVVTVHTTSRGRPVIHINLLDKPQRGMTDITGRRGNHMAIR